MEIVFKKVPESGVDFETSIDDIKFYGNAKKESKNLVLCVGRVEGTLLHRCDRCGDNFTLSINEEVKLYANDGLYEDGDELLDIMEFFDGSLNFDTILESEVGTIQSDYHYCSICKDN